MSEVKLEKENKLIKARDAVIKAIDEDGDGEIGIQDIIIKGLKIPGIKINRDQFLRKELFRKYPEEVIELAITTNPMKAGIQSADVQAIAKNIIQFERVCVSGISTVLGTPGGVAMVATIPADIIQYYGYLLRATQKLLYLYGFPSLMTEDEDYKIDTEVMNILILCMGVMYGVAGAKNGLLAVAKAFGVGLEKKLIKAALTKGTIYPIVKKTMSWFGVSLTKQIYAGFFKKAIPVAAGVFGGAITYLTFKPCCEKLRNTLKDSILSNPNYEGDKVEQIFVDEVIEDEQNVLFNPVGEENEEEVEVMAASYVPLEDGTVGELNEIETDEEWSLIEETLDQFSDEDDDDCDCEDGCGCDDGCGCGNDHDHE